MKRNVLVVSTVSILAATVMISAAAIIFNVNRNDGNKSKPESTSSIEDFKMPAPGNDGVRPGMSQGIGATGSIMIPGYETIVMKAGQKEQTVSLGNPGENECYFIITIQLQDGTEIFRSDMVDPGTEITSISLHQPLKAGIYNECILRYSCYDMNTLEELNGANTIFTLEVKA